MCDYCREGHESDQCNSREYVEEWVNFVSNFQINNQFSSTYTPTWKNDDENDKCDDENNEGGKREKILSVDNSLLHLVY